MDGHIPDIRLKGGSMNFPNGDKLEFLIGLVFNIEGNYILELHFDQTLNLEEFYNTHEYAIANGNCEVIATTIDKHEFKASHVSLKSFPFHKSMGDFYCNSSIQMSSGM